MRTLIATDCRLAALACYRVAEATAPKPARVAQPAAHATPPPQGTAPGGTGIELAVIVGGLAAFIGAPLGWFVVFAVLVVRSCCSSL